MRILIVSDTHRKNDNYFELLEQLGPLDMVIHCGDVEGSEYALSQGAECPVVMVSGNNDFFSQLPREQVWITHGHNYCVSMGVEMLKQEARAKGIDIVMFGHTHKPYLEVEEDLVTLNPGSLSYPRQDGKEPSYAMMEIDRFGKARFRIAYL